MQCPAALAPTPPFGPRGGELPLPLEESSTRMQHPQRYGMFPIAMPGSAMPDAGIWHLAMRHWHWASGIGHPALALGIYVSARCQMPNAGCQHRAWHCQALQWETCHNTAQTRALHLHKMLKLTPPHPLCEGRPSYAQVVDYPTHPHVRNLNKGPKSSATWAHGPGQDPGGLG